MKKLLTILAIVIASCKQTKKESDNPLIPRVAIITFMHQPHGAYGETIPKYYLIDRDIPGYMKMADTTGFIYYPVGDTFDDSICYHTRDSADRAFHYYLKFINKKQ